MSIRPGFAKNKSGNLIPKTVVEVNSTSGDLFSGDSPMVTGAGRLRTVVSVEQYSSAGFRYDDGGFLWLTAENIDGIASHNPIEKSRESHIGTAANSSLITQTRQRHPYFAGNSHTLTLAFLANLEIGRTCRVGYFDDRNGSFFQIYKNQLGELEFSVGRRTDITGTPVDEIIPQIKWNNDNLDGENEVDNPSKIKLLPENIHMVFIDFTWYGGGEIQMGFKINREYIPCHTFYAGNYLQEPIFADPNLPIRTEIFNQDGNIGITGSFIKVWGIHLGIDGSDPAQRAGFPRTIDVSKSITASAGEVPIIIVRPKLTFKGIPNHSWIRLKDFQIASSVNGVYKIIYNPVITGAVWTDVNTNASLMEYDESATSISGGIPLYTGVISSNKGGDRVTIPNFKEPLAVASDGSESYAVAVVFDGESNGIVNFAVNWEEIY